MELGDYHHQDDRGDAEELSEIDANGAANKGDAEQHGTTNTQDCAEAFEDAVNESLAGPEAAR